jgi:long-chain fatty acid transport protein
MTTTAKHMPKLKTNQNSRIAGFISLISFASILACPGSLFALGFAMPDQDAFATARGNAFVATADDPAAVYYNPAGISQLDGKHISLGAYGIVYGSSYNGASGSIDSKTQLAVLPRVFSSWSLPKYNLTLGLGAYSPYGMRTEWPAYSPFTTWGETGEIDYYTLNPVVAWQVIPSLSIAAGPTLNYSEADFKEFWSGLNFINHFRGRDTAVGFNVGVLWHPWQQHSFGVTYRSATDMNYNGHATSLAGSGDIAAQANFHFPQTVAFGYSFRPTTNWNIEADANWTDWSDLRTVYVSPEPQIDHLAFNWHPSWMFDLGATRYLGCGWRLSSGFMYSMDTVPDADFNALVPDSDRYVFSVGLGKNYKRFSWDVAYQLAWGPSRSIGTANITQENGSYEFLSHAITVNVGYHF